MGKPEKIAHRAGFLLFRWFSHPDYKEDIEGDLLERFNKRSVQLGITKAKWLFIKDVILLFRSGISKDFSAQIQHKLFTMKCSNWFKFVTINLLFIIAIILPFLPGPPNELVIALSVLGQSAGFFGLMLMPIGTLWSVLEIRRLRKINSGGEDWKVVYYLSLIVTIIVAGIYLLLLTAVFLNSRLVAGFLLLVLGIIGFYFAVLAAKKARNTQDRKLNLLPFSLLTIPLLAFVTSSFIVQPISDFSRSHAIKNCQSLIISIEEYKTKLGQYPESIQALEASLSKNIPSPDIMGILHFRYNKINDHYSISFSQWHHLGSLEEIVLYDKSNLKDKLEGALARYDYAFDLCRVKGASAMYDTLYENWRYYLVD